ncbi:hypothetical protein ACWEO2_27815 [Nocardia sp. NPDC004278]
MLLSCRRVFRPFSADEASKIAGGRNEYLHGAALGINQIPAQAWWPQFWAQTDILLTAQGRDISMLVGGDRTDEVERHLAQNTAAHRIRIRGPDRSSVWNCLPLGAFRVQIQLGAATAGPVVAMPIAPRPVTQRVTAASDPVIVVLGSVSQCCGSIGHTFGADRALWPPWRPRSVIDTGF